jgi:protein tyrosine phosphatase
VLKLTTEKLGSLSQEYNQLEQVGPAPGNSWGQHDAMVASNLCQAADTYPFMNRYSNLYPFDKNRFVLDTKEGQPDYINASWVKIAGEPRDIILTMAPLHPASFSGKVTTDFGSSSSGSTCPQFWRMVSQSRSKLVVMLCKLEKGYQGCSQYFPEKLGSQTFEDFTVELKSEDKVSEELVKRKLEVTNGDKKTNIQVNHLEFPLWPNYGVVKDVAQLANFLKQVNTKWDELCSEETTPMIIHCSGGIGRSGTFASALTVYRRVQQYLKTGDETLFAGVVDESGGLCLVPLVRTLREQRHPWMVEGQAQYQLAYATILHLIQELTN